MVDMKPWIDHWNEHRGEYEEVCKAYEEAKKHAKEILGIDESEINLRLEFRPIIALERDEEGLLSIWQRPEYLKGVELDTDFWSMFEGGQALLNRDGSVSYTEENYMRRHIVVDKEYYLGVIKVGRKTEFRLVTKPDYNTIKYLPPFKSPEAYEKYQRENWGYFEETEDEDENNKYSGSDEFLNKLDLIPY